MTTYARYYGGGGTADLDAVLAEIALLNAKINTLLGLNGTENFVINLNESDADPIVGAIVHITSDVSGATKVYQNLISDSSGKVTVKLNPGIYYVWVSHPSYNIPNPTSVTVEDV